MTTIATDGITIAADGRATAGGNIVSDRTKKIIVEDGVIYALTGVEALFRALIDWIKKGADPAAVPKGYDATSLSWALTVISAVGPMGAKRYTSTMPYPDSVDYPFSDGTGHEMAVVLMDAGKSPFEAVRLTCKRDINSGGEIQVVNIAEALGQPALKLVGETPWTP